jgi:hypothetical protein
MATRRSTIVAGLVEAMFNTYLEELFCSMDNEKEWYQWNGNYWEQKDLSDLKEIVYNMILNKHPGYERIALIYDVIALLAIKMRRKLDLPPVGHINFLNGVLRVNDLTLLPHDPLMNFMYIIKVD